jgi:hypothetical protein
VATTQFSQLYPGSELLQPAASAIWEVVSSLLILSWINSSVDLARLGAMVRCITGVSAWSSVKTRGDDGNAGRGAPRL